MIASLETWYRGRSRREQWLLLVMVALFAVVLVSLGIVRPLAGALDDARTRHGEAVTALGRVRADADSLRDAARLGAAPAPEAPLPTLVSTAAANAGFPNAGVTPGGGGRVTVTIASARPPALFGLVADLARRGVIVERFSSQAGADQTLSVDMTLIAAGR